MARRRRIKGRPPGTDVRIKRLADGSAREYWFYRPLGLAEGRLPGRPGDPEFHAEYARKAAQWRSRHAPKADPETLGQLIASFKAARQFTELSASSRKDYGAALDAILKDFGKSTPLCVMDHARMHGQIEKWHESMRQTPRKADLWLAVLHRLLAFGVKKERLAHNRAGGIKRLYVSTRARLIWTEAAIETFCGGASAELAWAVRLAYATGQRQGDLLALTWNDVSAEGITFRTSKTGVRIFVPLYDELREALEGISKRGVQVLTTAAGRPWQPDTFRHEFRAACRAANVGEGLHFHDLRGSALKAFADAGASELELRAISGHSMSTMAGALGSYIDAFKSLAESAVRKRENAGRTKTANQQCKPSAGEGAK